MAMLRLKPTNRLVCSAMELHTSSPMLKVLHEIFEEKLRLFYLLNRNNLCGNSHALRDAKVIRRPGAKLFPLPLVLFRDAKLSAVSECIVATAVRWRGNQMDFQYILFNKLVYHHLNCILRPACQLPMPEKEKRKRERKAFLLLLKVMDLFFNEDCFLNIYWNSNREI